MAKTSCDWIVERLPWWANETLEEGEAERVAAHLDECAACREELAATREAMALYGAHLPIEALLDLAQEGAGEKAGGGRPGGVSRAAADAHLGHCAECRDELALLRESRAAVAAEGEEEGGKVTAFTTRRPAASPGGGRRRGFDRRAVALAASILVAVVAAGGWLSSHRAADERGERLAELERRLEAVTAAQLAAEEVARAAPVDERTAAGDEAALAELEAENERLEQQIARLEAEIEDESAAAEGDRLVLVGAARPWDVRRVVVRGPEPPPADAVDTIDAGAATTFSYYITGAGDRPLRVVVEDLSSGRRLYETPADPRFEVGDSGPHVLISVPLAELPEGTVRVRLFSGGEELGSRLLRVER